MNVERVWMNNSTSNPLKIHFKITSKPLNVSNNRELYLRELEADERNVVHSVSLRRGAVGGDGDEGVEQRKGDVDAVDALPRGGVRVCPTETTGSINVLTANNTTKREE